MAGCNVVQPRVLLLDPLPSGLSETIFIGKWTASFFEPNFDVLLGGFPFFHSLSLMATIWSQLS